MAELQWSITASGGLLHAEKLPKSLAEMPAEGLSFEFGGLHSDEDVQHGDKNGPRDSAFSRTVLHYGPSGQISSIRFDHVGWWHAMHQIWNSELTDE
jgi:hypothetical protein